MKNKKVLTISLIAVAVALASFACVAIIQAQKKEPPKETPLGESGLYTKKEEAPGPKVYAEGTANEKVLKYEKTMHLSDGQTMDIYLDAEGKQYRYDESGALKGIVDRSNGQAKKGEIGVEELAAREIADKLGAEIYGEEFEGFSFEAYTETATGIRTVQYSKRYGDGDYILGPTISFMLTAGGELYSTSNLNSTEYEEFDEKMLTFKKADVDKFVEQELKETGEGTLISSTPDQYRLKWENGKYYLSVGTKAVYDSYEIKMVVRYDFKQ
jgi:hypothetical protein